MSITLTTKQEQPPRDNTWELYWFHKTDLDANYPADEATLERAGFVRASRLAAAEAMVEDAKALSFFVCRLDTPTEKQRAEALTVAKRILAYRPSEQALCSRCGDAYLSERKCPASNFSLFCNPPETMLQAEPSEQASKEDSGWTDQDVVMSRIQELEVELSIAQRDRDAFDSARIELVAKLEAAEASLAEVKESRRLERVAKADAEIALSECQSQLEAAEAEGAHLLEAADLLRLTMRDRDTLHTDRMSKWYYADCRKSPKFSAPAATEEPKAESALCIHCLKPVHEGDCEPQPHPQGARLGGPADKLRADICAALRRHGVDNDEHSWDECMRAIADELERLGKNP